jgi:hypothetical protein
MEGIDQRRNRMKASRGSQQLGTRAGGQLLFSMFVIAAVFGVGGVLGNIYWSGTGYVINVIASWIGIAIGVIMLGLALNGLRLHLREKRKMT